MPVPKTLILDIGGFTAGYLQLKYGRADLSTCGSPENGVIQLYNRIRSRANAEYDILLDEGDVDSLLHGAERSCCGLYNKCRSAGGRSSSPTKIQSKED